MLIPIGYFEKSLKLKLKNCKFMLNNGKEHMIADHNLNGKCQNTEIANQVSKSYRKSFRNLLKKKINPKKAPQ